MYIYIYMYIHVYICIYNIYTYKRQVITDVGIVSWQTPLERHLTFKTVALALDHVHARYIFKANCCGNLEPTCFSGVGV